MLEFHDLQPPNQTIFDSAFGGLIAECQHQVAAGPSIGSHLKVDRLAGQDTLLRDLDVAGVNLKVRVGRLKACTANPDRPHELASDRTADLGLTQIQRPIEGEHRAPPEDCGGTPGFEAFLEAVADPRHPEHEDATEWHQGCYGKPFDPDEIDERDAMLRIGAIAKRRAAGKAAQAKKSR